MSDFRSFFSHPIVGFIGSVCSLIGVPLAIFFYLKTVEVRQLVYLLDPIRATVVNTREDASIKVLFKGEELCPTNITIAQLSIWNDGKKSIRPENVLEPVTIVFPETSRILDVNIIKLSRPLTRFRVDDANTGYDKGRVAFTWDILEQNDGGSVQITYTGDASVTIGAVGVIEGSGSIRSYSIPIKIRDPQDQLRQIRMNVYRISGLLGLVFLSSLVVLIFTMGRKWRMFGVSVKSILIAYIIISSLFLIMTWVFKARLLGVAVPF